MTDREKIAEIIKKNGTYNGRSLSFDYYVIQPDDLADALIAAGIGDISKWQLMSKVLQNQIIENSREEKHRTEVNEKMFDILYEETSKYMKVLSKEWYKVQAEHETEEENND